MLLSGIDYILNSVKTRECVGFGITVEYTYEASVREKLELHFRKQVSMANIWRMEGIVPHNSEVIILEFAVQNSNPSLEFIRETGLVNLHNNLTEQIQKHSNLIIGISDVIHSKGGLHG